MPFINVGSGNDLILELPTDRTQVWGTRFKTNFATPIAEHNHTGSGNGRKLGAGSFSADSITDVEILLSNNSYLRGRNAADSADVNIIKVNASDKLETEVAINTPVGVGGTLRAGIRGTVITHLRGEVGVEGAASKYGDVVERGRRPGRWPPRDAIELWVKRIIKPEPKKLKSMAFLVQRKVGKIGFKGKFMFRDAEKKLKTRVTNMFRIATKRIERRLSK